MAESPKITELLAAWSSGDTEAGEQALPLVYDALKALARHYFRRERRDHTLQATALVHEAWVRLAEGPGVRFESRAHFVGLVAHVMRRALVDHARERNTAKRGGKAVKITLTESDATTEPELELIALDAALEGLAARDPRKAKIVELRFFGGLSVDETARALGVSPKTVGRQWRLARAWLYRRLAADSST